jgi:hypothetical protein
MRLVFSREEGHRRLPRGFLGIRHKFVTSALEKIRAAHSHPPEIGVHLHFPEGSAEADRSAAAPRKPRFFAIIAGIRPHPGDWLSSCT